MPDPITVVCVLRYGGAYDMAYVLRLRDGVKRHLPTARFVCMGDSWIDGVDNEPLWEGWPGWWSKMHLFSPGLWGDGLVLYLDLDTVVVGSLSDLAGYGGDLAVLADLYRPDTMIGSGVMLWRCDAMRPVWDAFTKDPDEVIRKNPVRMDYFIQDFVGDADRVQTLWPDQVVSYKRDVRPAGGVIPEASRLVCMHGRPRLHQLKEDDAVSIAWRTDS